VYFCWLEALEGARDGTRATVTVRDEEGPLTFEVVANGVRSHVELVPLRDRIEALGGQVAVQPQPGGGTRVSGSLPLSR